MENSKTLMIVVQIGVFTTILVTIIYYRVYVVPSPYIFIIVHMSNHHTTGRQLVIPDTHILLSVLDKIILILVIVIVHNKCLPILHILCLHTFY